ncbi:MAG: ribose 5-phosphate isomerase B [Thermomicrobiales bacterium]|nr:ribose 5-phosphate isomerase B [Thermomicrobiales bacterium]
MRIALAADHAGYLLKAPVADALRAWGYEVADHGTHSGDVVDFPDVVLPVCRAVLNREAERGILLCGTGIGACMAANKVAGIRAALCHDLHSAHQAVEHDDANVMCLGAKIVGEWLALDLIRAFLDARFGGEEHFQRRIDKMAAIESGRLR